MSDLEVMANSTQRPRLLDWADNRCGADSSNSVRPFHVLGVLQSKHQSVSDLHRWGQNPKILT